MNVDKQICVKEQMLCGTDHSCNYEELRSSCIQSRDESLEASDYLYINVIYFVLFSDANNEDENVSLFRIRSQHQTLNEDLNMGNPDTSHVPSSGRYNFASVRGSTNLRVLPLDPNDINQDSDQIKRIVSPDIPSNGFTGLTQVESFINSTGLYTVPVPGVLNVYICPLSGNLLGQAELFSNHCVVKSETVGGIEAPGPSSLANYNLGRTLTHESFHCFGIPHVFSDSGTCPISRTFADIPRQKRPNSDAILTETGGIWNGSLDNRFRDCNQPTYNIPGVNPPYSCISLPNCGTSDYEQFFNFLDYGSDLVSIMISKDQVSTARLAIPGLFSLQSGPVDPGVVPVARDPMVPAFIPTQIVSGEVSSSSSGFPLWVIWIIVGIIVVVIIVVVSLYLTKWKYKR